MTRNTKDFCITKGALHPELTAERDTIGLPADCIVVRDAIDQVLLTLVAPVLEWLGQIREQLQQNILAGLDLSLWLTENLAEHIDLNEGSGPEVSKASISGIARAGLLRISQVRRLPSGEILIGGESEVDASVELSIGKMDTCGETEVKLRLTFLLTYSEDEKQVTGCDVIPVDIEQDVPDDYDPGDYDPGPPEDEPPG